MSSPILKTEDLAKSYGDFAAVKGVNFSIDQGEIYSLLGPNGAGKTTTISMLSTLLAPSSGEAWIAGHSIKSEAMQVREAIGVIPQEIALYNTLTAMENLRFWGRMYGLEGQDLRQRSDRALVTVGLTDRAKNRVGTFSGGMKRRLNIAVGLLHSPQVVFMDEPTVGIDPQSRRAILDTVKDLNEQGLTVLYTTHYMEEAQELSDRVGIIDHGDMIACGTQEELTHLVGEHETLHLHVDENCKSEALAEALEALDCVQKASVVEQEVIVMVEKADEALAPVITKASQLDCRIRSVDIQEPNLEAVFLHLTGRALRD